MGLVKGLDDLIWNLPTTISGSVDISELSVICYDTWVLSVGRKNYFKDWCLINSQPTFLFLT